MTRLEKKARFIRLLAEYLQMGKEHAKEWAALRAISPVFGYTTIDEAEESLKEFLC